MTHIPAEVIEKATTYHTYRDLISQLLSENKTTGNNHSEAMLHYTHLNTVRMNRLDKKTELSADSLQLISQIKSPQIWLTITEAWCGDAAQILPVIQKMADQSDKARQLLILRDENPEIMDAFLTNGSRSIPIVIIIDETTREILGSWGPRPIVPQEMVVQAKSEMLSSEEESLKKQIFDDVKVATQKWYAKDKTMSIQSEFTGILKTIR